MGFQMIYSFNSYCPYLSLQVHVVSLQGLELVRGENLGVKGGQLRLSLLHSLELGLTFLQLALDFLQRKEIE